MCGVNSGGGGEGGGGEDGATDVVALSSGSSLLSCCAPLLATPGSVVSFSTGLFLGRLRDNLLGAVEEDEDEGGGGSCDESMVNSDHECACLRN